MIFSIISLLLLGNLGIKSPNPPQDTVLALQKELLEIFSSPSFQGKLRKIRDSKGVTGQLLADGSWCLVDGGCLMAIGGAWCMLVVNDGAD